MGSSATKDKLANMFNKVRSGTVTKEEGTMLLNSLVKADADDTIEAITDLFNNPPPDVSAQDVFHTIAITRNRKFFDLLTSALDHKNEEVSIFACEELATYFRGEAKFVLEEHLNSETYHVRKSSAETLVKIFGDEGVEALKRHISSNKQSHYHCLTSAQALLKAGKKGVDALIQVLNSGNPIALATVAGVLASAAKQVGDGDIPKVVDALTWAGDANDAEAITALLKAVAAFGPRARQFEWWVRAYEDHADAAVSREAKACWKAISGQK